MAPGKHRLDQTDLPRRLTVVPSVDDTDESEAVAVLRAASDRTGPLEVITPDMLARVRSGLLDDR